MKYSTLNKFLSSTYGPITFNRNGNSWSIMGNNGANWICSYYPATGYFSNNSVVEQISKYFDIPQEECYMHLKKWSEIKSED